MTQTSTTDPVSQSELSTSTAHRRAMKILWLDILVTFAVLAAVASQL